ncbi:MAG: DNA (cytosine-5-)-methyltransferase [Minisyncoccia bacterium]
MSITKPKMKEKTVADFFAGIGLVTMGLEKAGWKTVYALDYEKAKAAAYENNFGQGHYHVSDIADVKGKDVPDVMLAHASFPCTDLSVAGARGGIHAGESSAFWHFLRILKEMRAERGDGKPPFVLVENVEGLLSSNQGKDLRAVLSSLNELGYLVDLIMINGANFVPQSRVRIFVVGVHSSAVNVSGLADDILSQQHNLGSSNARPEKIAEYISANADLKWYFHSLPNLPQRQISLEEIVDPSAEWWEKERTEYLYDQMHDRHKIILEAKKKESRYSYFTVFRRMRVRNGKSLSTAELRTDGIAGCLRTPKGGSARQIIVRAGRGKIDARLINGKEAARLMGADEFKINPDLSLNDVLFGFGDAVCVPVLEWLGNHYLNSISSLQQTLRLGRARPVQFSV